MRRLAVRLEGTTAHITGLRAGATYRFSVAAVNTAGTGPTTDSAAITLPDVPGAPTLLPATRGDRQAEVTWREPGSDGGRPITGYLLTVSPQGTQLRLEATARSATVRGLTNGAPSTFTVRALNVVGEGLESAPAGVVPGTVPSAPTGLEVTPGIREATVSWSEPASTGGLPVREYLVTVEPGGTVLRTSAQVRSTSVTGLRNGTEYTFTVVARNEVGEGQGAASAPLRTLDVPLAPVSVKATVGERSATVTWQAPAADGGSPITGYTVESWPPGPRVHLDAQARTATLPDLPSTRRYSFTVSATNAVGTSAASAHSLSVRPLPAPVQVTALAVPSSTDGCLSVSYSLQQPDGERADVVVEVEPKADGSFQRVTQAGSTDHEGLLALSTSPRGAPHSFLWNRASDVPGATVARVRVSARVPGTALDSETVDLTLPAPARRCEPRLDTSLIRTAQGKLVAGTVGDLNRDGKPDLVLSAESGTALHVMLGLGNGGFRPALRHEVGGWSHNDSIPVTTDLDGDGTLDLLWVASVQGLSVARGRGDGSFEVARTYPVGPGSFNDSPPAIAVADFDGNGSPDVAVVTGSTGLNVLLNEGNGTLGAYKSLGLVGMGVQLTVADLNEDGREDLVATGGFVATLLSKGDGTFQRHFVSGVSPVDGMTLGDFDRDGHLDLVITEDDVGDTRVVLRRGDGQGGFSASTRVATLMNSTSHWERAPLAAADLDGDGLMDLAVALEEEETLALLPGRGDGGFGPAVHLPSGRQPRFVMTSDFDADGVADVATLHSSSNDVRVWRGGPGRTTRELARGPAGSFTTGDFNGDGRVDVVSSGAESKQVQVSLAGPNGLSALPPMEAGATVFKLVATHVDADAALDVVVMYTEGNTLGLLLGNGDGTLRRAADVSLGAMGVYAETGDVNGDGKRDLVFRAMGESDNVYTDDVRLLLGRGDGTFEPPVVLKDAGEPVRLALGDLDRDGRQDLVVTQQPSGRYAKVLRGQGDGTFSVGADVTFGSDFHGSAFVLADLDRDGILDALTSGHRSYEYERILVLKGNGTGGFSPRGEYSTEGNGSNLTVLDFDADGWLDVLSANPGRDSVSLLRGLGSGRFAVPDIFGAYGYGAAELVVVDTDGDGLRDLLVGGSRSTHNALLRQH